MGSAKLWGISYPHQSVALHPLIVFRVLTIKCYVKFFVLKMCLDVIRLNSNEHGRAGNPQNPYFHKITNKLADTLRINLIGILETNQKFIATR